jgi:hypothetical protein
VIVGGVPHTTDAGGQARLSQTFPPTATLDVLALGFLDRQTSLGDSRAMLSMWPKTSPAGLTEDATFQIVYGGGNLPLARLPAGVTEGVIVLSPEVLGDSVFAAAHEEAVARLNRSLAGLINYRLATQSPESDPRRQVISTRIDPAASFCSDNDASASGPSLSAKVTYCHRVSQALIQHELGHTFGFRHSTESSDVMHPLRRPGDLSAREVLLASLMVQRNAGNRFPDLDRSGTAPLSAVEAVEGFDCAESR